MSDPKVVVPYDHDSADTAPIHIGLSPVKGKEPAEWKGAFRDVEDGRKIVWARFPALSATVQVWVRDSAGARPVRIVSR